MLSRFFGDNIHRYLHILGLCGLAFGIPMNKVVMSISMVFLGLNFFLEAKFIERWKNLKVNRAYWILFAFFAFHVIGVLWSTDIDYALHDLRVKAPIFVIPTLIVAHPITNRSDLNLILSSFTLSVLMVSFINYGMYQHWFGNQQYDDIRGMSLFCSHVRFGIIVSMAVGILLYFLKYFKQLRILLLLFVVWLSYYTFYSQVISGATTLATVFLAFSTYLLWGKRKTLAITFLSVFIVAFTTLAIWLFNPIKVNPEAFKNLPTHTAEGNPYIHYDKLVSPETGGPIYLYICEEELQRDWPKYSQIPYFGFDKKGQPIRFTLLRYLASKELRKDAEGLAQLSAKEIKDIENGIGSARNYGLMGRLYGLKYQLVNEQDQMGTPCLNDLNIGKLQPVFFQKTC